ncbi:MAG: UDP-3-O-(3-hydroxymyristoyl)glucosamine N-acyltransferase [Betaproteobacteria bacterium]
MPNPAFTLRDLAAAVGATVDGDASVVVRRMGTLERADRDAIAFLADARHRPQLEATRAGAVIVTPELAAATALPKLVHRNPYVTYARVAALLHPVVPIAPGIDGAARVDPTARIDASAAVAPFAVIGARAVLGPGTVVGAGTYIGDDVELSAGVHVHARAVIYAGTVLGERTVVFSGAVIGADGFGMADDNGRWLKIPQVGRVIVGADCEIGANTTIDRGAIDDTVIEDGVKLDNQIQVAHNCRIGAHTAVAGCVGIAGSVDIGRHCRIGGAAMIAGHLSIVDGTTISAGTLVSKSIVTPGAYTGTFPALPHREWRHVASELRRIRELTARVAALERQLREHGSQSGDSS